jgi:hypothetical protein
MCEVVVMVDVGARTIWEDVGCCIAVAEGMLIVCALGGLGEGSLTADIVVGVG